MAWNELLIKVGMDSSGFTSGTTAVKRSVSGLQNGMLSLSRTITDQKAKLKELGSQNLGASTQYKKLKAEISDNERMLRSMNTELRNTIAVSGKAGGAVGGFGSILSGIASRLGPAAIATGIGVLAKSAIDVQMEFEKMGVVLANALGSNSEAQKAMKEIQDFSAKTPFQVDELTEAYLRLTNRGMQPTMDQMRQMGDLAASQGKSFIQLTEAILDAATGEFERLKEFGIKGRKEGDKVTLMFKNQTVEVKNTQEAISEAIRAMGDYEGVAGGMAAISGTLSGKVSNLKDNFSLLLNEFKGVFGMAGYVVDGLLGITGALRKLNEITIRIPTSFEEMRLAAAAGNPFMLITDKANAASKSVGTLVDNLKKASKEGGMGRAFGKVGKLDKAVISENSIKDEISKLQDQRSEVALNSAEYRRLGQEIEYLEKKLGKKTGSSAVPDDLKASHKVIITPVIDAARMTAVVDGIEKTFTDSDVMRIGYGAGIQYITGMETGIASKEIKLDIGPTRIAEELGIFAKLDSEFTAAENRFKVFGDEFEFLQSKLSATSQAINSALEIQQGDPAVMNELISGYDAIISKIKEMTAAQREAAYTQQLMSDTLLTVSSAASESFAAIATGSKKSGDAVKDFAREAVKAILKFVQAKLLAAAASQIEDGSSKYGWYGLIIAAGAIAGIYSMIDSAASKSKQVRLAKGGAAFSETAAIIGDNPNARFDPEVVAPLSKIENMISVKGGQHLTGTVVVKGPDLLIAIQNAERYMGKVSR